jgi:outer membrane protein
MRTFNTFLFNFIFLILLPAFVFSQPASNENSREWSFSECVTYGMEHNLTLQIDENQLSKQQITYQQSVWQLAPSINGWSNANLNFNRSTDQNNQISSGSSYSVSYGVNGSLTLFNGLSTLNQIAAMRFNKLAYAQQNEQQKIILYIEILKSFALASYNKQQVKITEEQVELVKKNKAVIESKTEVGLLGSSAVDEINATLSGNQWNYNKQKNTYELSLLSLAQLIDLPDSENLKLSENDFDLVQPSVTPYTALNVYELACQNLPALKEKEYRLAYFKKILRTNQGQDLPNLNIGAGYYSGFYSTDTLANGKPTSFNNQYTKYLNPTVSLNLNIPIFNKRNTELLIKKSRIDIEIAVIELELQKKEIFKEIQSAIQQLNASLLEYQSAIDNLNYVEKSYRINSEKYTLGLITSTDFITAQNQLLQAKTNVVAAKYAWILQEKIVRLYSGLHEF